MANLQNEENPEKPKQINFIKQNFDLFKKDFHLCWKGACRTISIISIALYALVVGSILVCILFKVGACSAQGILGMGPLAIILIILASVISIILAFFSQYTKTALLFWILLDIPIILFVLFLSLSYIGFLIIGLIIFTRLIQGTRR